MDILQIEGLKKIYGKNLKKSSRAETMAIKGLNLSIKKGSFIGIMGRSGCGKTTLLKLLGGLEFSTEGEIRYLKKTLTHLNNEQLARYRREEVGFVFQDYNLMESLTVKENIMLPMLLNKKKIKEIEESVRYYSKYFGIEKLLNKYPEEISGGEQQRTSICRALANDPHLILADEPTGNLDSQSSKEVIGCLKEMNVNLGKTVVLVTHDPYIASFADQVVLLKDGLVEKILKKDRQRDLFLKNLLENLGSL